MPYRNSEPDPGPPPATGGRPRDHRREAEILAVVTALLADRGYDGISFEEVARRAGASKATLYRRWNSKRDMVIAALKAGPAQREGAGAIDTGSLRGDLLALCGRLASTMQSSDSQAALLLLQAGLEDPELCEEIERAVGPTGARLPPSVIEAAVTRGELAPGTDPFAFEEVAGAAILLRRMNGLDLSADYLRALVDVVLLPALVATGSAAAGAPLPAGIFSGHPAPNTPRPETVTSETVTSETVKDLP